MTGWTASTGTERVLLGGRYELVRHIARGGMGDVFEATDHQLARQVAVKRFRGSSPQDRPRFDTEVLALARLNHPNLVQVYDSGEHDGVAFLVMELIEGPSLQTILQARVALPPPEVASLGTSLADALDYVHDKGVVHRDVAPANVLCGEDGRPRLADFGIARLVDTSRITAVATTIGTAAYMAPEQLEGHDVTPAVDIYSLGLVLLEALAGRPGFEGTSSEVAVARLVRDPDTTTGVPGEWSELLARMTARDPASRPTAGRARDQLAALAAGRPAPALDVTAAAAVAGLAAAPMAGGGGGEAVAAGPEVDPLAQTRPIPVAGAAVGAVQHGGTAVMPVAVPSDVPVEPTAGRAGEQPRPGAARSHRRSPGDPRGRQLAWLIVAGLVVALLMGLASRSSDGSGLPTNTTAVAVEEPAPTTTAVPATVAPAPPPPPAPEPGDEGDDGKENGKGNEGKGNEGKDEDKDDD